MVSLHWTQVTPPINKKSPQWESYDSRWSNGHSYTYGDATWADLLTAVDGHAITYDAAGNPTSYYNGTNWTFTWEHGRNLGAATNGTTSLEFTYDVDGLRTTKKVNDVLHTYYYAGGTLLRETYGNTVLDFFYAGGTPYALKHNGTLYYYITNLQGDVMSIVDEQGNVVASYQYDPYGNVISATGDLAETNPLRYRGYYYDAEIGMYYLQSRYYDPELGRFINADSYASTGQGVLGNNMFVYCGNNPVVRVDGTGTSFREAFAASCYERERGSSLCDYVIYYYHPDSSKNLDGPAIHNHKSTNDILVSAGTFEELVDAMNSVPCGIDDVYIYIHSDDRCFSFYYEKYYYATDIANNMREVSISGEIYLFSCKGGRGELASTMAAKTNRTVVASVYKVSFGDGFARCGWVDYYWYSRAYAEYAWHCYYPDGSSQETSKHYVFVN